MYRLIQQVTESRNTIICTLSRDFNMSIRVLYWGKNTLLNKWPWNPETFISIQFSPSVMSNSLQSHGLQHARPPCPLPAPGVYSNSCSLSQWCYPAISSSVVPFSSHLQSFPASESSESVLRIRWPKYWGFSFNSSPFHEHSGLISLRMEWLDLLAVQGTLKSLPDTMVQKRQFFGAQLSL